MSSAGEQDRFWSGFARKDESFLSAAPDPFFEEIFAYQRSLCRDLEGTAVLEIGCGDGTDAVGMIHEHDVSSVIAIDISEARTRAAMERVNQAGLSGRIQVLKMDANRIEFPDDHFDVIFGNSICLFLDRDRFFPEAARVLKPGGRLILLTESLAGNPLLGAYRRFNPAARKRGLEKLARRLTVNEINGAEGRYFAHVEHHEFHVFFVILRRIAPWFVRKWLRLPLKASVGRWSCAMDRAVLRTFKGLRRFAWIAVVCFTTRTAEPTSGENH